MSRFTKLLLDIKAEVEEAGPHQMSLSPERITPNGATMN